MAKRDPMIHVRVPDDLKESLEREAKANGRSLNAEVLRRIDNTFSQSEENIDKNSIEINKALVLARAFLAKEEGVEKTLNEEELSVIRFWRSINRQRKDALKELVKIAFKL